ncbi:MAG: spermidine synthase [Bryobacteraceae bacterium]
MSATLKIPFPSRMAGTVAPYAATIFLSAFLLFTIEPLVAKRILPWFGGSSAVWATCLVFYQAALLLGYWYTRVSTLRLDSLAQCIVHTLLLVLSCLLLPVGPGERWSRSASDHPASSILLMLTVTVGPVLLALTSTSPLLQQWLAQEGARAPHRLFALSNLASLCGLLAYPIVVEPRLEISIQAKIWSWAYLVFASLSTWVTWRTWRLRNNTTQNNAAERIWILPTRRLAWFSLACCSSALLLSVTNHLDENVAAVPLLWVLPLAVYLITFIVAFNRPMRLRRDLLLGLVLFALGILGYASYDVNSVEAIQVSVPVFLGGLFICCFYCHAELARLRPEANELSGFYLMIAAGGATGSILVGVLAPQLFRGIYELPITLVAMPLLTVVSGWGDNRWLLRLGTLAATSCMLAVVANNVKAYHENTLALLRSFYGSLRVVQSPHTGATQTRTLFHGIIEHGSQYVQLPLRRHATTYYGPESGIGIVLRECFDGPKRVGVVGLGAGTIAAYGKLGDQFRFYELNPQVIDLANSLFSYLRETPATITIVPGDARLSLVRDNSPPFDVLALDAFSGDAIPVHLLTREAMGLYRRHLKQGGVLAFHVSNDFLDLGPVVKRLADSIHMNAVLARNHANPEEGTLASDWVLVTNNHTVLDNATVKVHSEPLLSRTDLRTWTDGYNNLLEILKTPSIRASSGKDTY